MSIDTEMVQRWLDAYTHAWITYDPGEIGALFTDNAESRNLSRCIQPIAGTGRPRDHCGDVLLLHGCHTGDARSRLPQPVGATIHS